MHQVLGSQGEVWKTLPNPLKVGEVVLVADKRENRLNWKMGVGRQLIIGRGGFPTTRTRVEIYTIIICERDFEHDAQRVCLQILKVSEESLGRDETPRQTSHEHFTSDIFLILYCINFNSCTCGWESFCDRGPDC